MDDSYIDEDSEPIMDFDAHDPSLEPKPYDDLEDNFGDDGGDTDWNCDHSPMPVHSDDGADSSSKPWKCLLKKVGGGGGGLGMTGDGLDDWGEAVALADVNVDKDKKRMKEDGRERDRGTGMAREKKGSGGGGHEEQDEGEREIQEL